MQERGVSIPAVLRELRKAVGKTQRQIADELEMHHSYICKIEKGKKRVSPEFLLRISSSLDIDPILLLLRAGHMQLPGFARDSPPQEPSQRLNELWGKLTDVDQEETIRYMRYLLLRAEVVNQESSIGQV